jgi:hypothetical protein
MGAVRGILVMVMVGLTGAGRQAPSAAEVAGLPAVVQVGAIPFPAEAADAEGTAVRVGGISGIAWLGDDGWIAVMDNSDRLLSFGLDLAVDGMPLAVRDLRALRLSARHDYEDVAVCPPAVAERIARRWRTDGRADPRPFVFVCEEDTPAIRGVSLADGSLLGRVPLPPILGSMRPNRGLESLATDLQRRLLWTANEEALPEDGPPSTVGAGTVVRLVAIPLPADDGAAAEADTADPPGTGSGVQLAYAVDPPHGFVQVMDRGTWSGVVALVVLPGPAGGLLVLERSGAAGLPPFENRLYFVDPAAGVDVAGTTAGLAARVDRHVAKRLLWRAALGCNLEGLALGPELASGGRALVAVADDGGLDATGRIVVLRITSP